jgi:hypothetical protein
LLFALVQSSLGWMRELGHGQQGERSLLGLAWVQSLAVEAVSAVCPGGRGRPSSCSYMRQPVSL